jgi:hypothetical protein
MKQLMIAAIAFASMRPCGGVLASAQSMDDLNLQVHGYATQGFVYSTNNNWDTTSSTDGSAAWTEAVVNLTVQPQSRLRVGVQARYFLLGNYGNSITLDWAQADYKASDKFGFRVGKVKTPMGLLNESQDIDPAQLWVLLPQSVYPIASRNSLLSHYGGVAYGRLPLGEKLGTLEYRGFGGQRIIGADDGFVQPFKDQGITVPNGFTGPLSGGTLRWNTPVQGLTVGATRDVERLSAAIYSHSMPGTLTVPALENSYFFGRYEHNKLMVAGEYNRVILNSDIQFAGIPAILVRYDVRGFYAMASYRLSDKLTGGLYYGSMINLQLPVSSGRYQRDWALCARYDFNPFLYAKIEQHIIDGTGSGFSTSDNSALQPNTRMTMLKLGVSF